VINQTDPAVAGRRWNANPYSVATILVAAVCFGIAVSVHLVFLTLIGVALALRAVQRKEALSRAALVMAVILVPAGLILSGIS
jgi:hypothetical protein